MYKITEFIHCISFVFDGDRTVRSSGRKNAPERGKDPLSGAVRLCPVLPDDFYAFSVSHKEKPQRNTAEKAAFLLQTFQKCSAEELQSAALLLAHLVRAERRFLPE